MSLEMKAIGWYLRRFKKPAWASAEKFERKLGEAKADPRPPARLQRQFSILERRVRGYRCYAVKPRARTSRPVVIYLHGGGYISEIAPQHWDLIGQLAAAGAPVEVPLYGLLPQHTFSAAYDFLTELYRELNAQHGNNLVLMGDSAGGGLALGLAQLLPGLKLPAPRHLTLISPWLDITCKNPDSLALDALDPWLSRTGGLLAGKLWARGADMDDPRLSPLNGEVRHLPSIDIYTGTHDVLYPDIRLFQERVQALGEAGPRLDLTICPGAYHVYPLLPVPEGRAATRRIVARLAALP